MYLYIANITLQRKYRDSAKLPSFPSQYATKNSCLMTMRLTTCFLLSFGLLATTVSAGKLKGYMSKSSIPSSGKEWISLENGVEFQPGTEANLSAAGVRKLWGSGKSSERTIFADGTETFYDDYAQAWRLLGFYVDCDFCADESNSNAAYCIQQGQQTTCQRFLLWAAVSINR